ncbi:BREX-1 system adenine-specific DNA-methyltransferase PglX [Micromonospora sp. NPDC000729]|uniref:BREX-1 system adenine-specific DNA-methyltransferase PglX n=1 Tax=Micromonospora sp. NPDC000729 TaxID=3364220 RepID=UPI00368D0DA4
METAPLKSFATWARTALIREVTARIAVVLAPASPERVEQPKVVEALEKAVSAAGGGDKGKAAVADRVAYTWFNRIIALRFMDANRYTGTGVVSSQAGVDSGQPEILAEAKRGNIDATVVGTKTRETVMGLLNGTRRSEDPQGEAYALLLSDHCRYWNRAMPFMFEREGDFNELLIPANLLADDSVLNRAVKVLTTDVCHDVEVIGWLYQFYISERKHEVFAGFKKSNKAGADEIPAATQLFTPHWIVRYLVENSLGRLWMLNRPSSRLVDQMDYYIAPVDSETDFLNISGPEELKVIDPACGSGHMLTYAFDLLYAIYEEEGYAPAEIPGLILTNNLYGAEIDPRAGALAAFALTMKARARQRTFFNKQVEPNVCVLDPIRFTPDEIDFLLTRGGDRHIESAFWTLFEHADTLGSLIQPDATLTARLKQHAAQFDDGGDILTADVLHRAARVVLQAEYLSPRYSVAVANPPYMGAGNMGPLLSEFAKRTFPTSKADLFAMFIERCTALVCDRGAVAMITMQSWMFLSTFENLREQILAASPIRAMAHLGAGAFETIGGEVVTTTAFVLGKGADRLQRSDYVRLVDLPLSKKPAVLRAAASARDSVARYDIAPADFAEIPGSPIAYWLSPATRGAFREAKYIGDISSIREGINTGNNALFLRRWWEVSQGHITFDRTENGEQSQRWVPHKKGGAFRRWAGNEEYILDWGSAGVDIHAYHDVPLTTNGAPMRGKAFFFHQSLSWSRISTSDFSIRFYSSGFSYDSTAPSIFGADFNLRLLLGLLNTVVVGHLLHAMSPTLDYRITALSRIPLPSSPSDVDLSAVCQLVQLARKDWDGQEISWGFSSTPWLEARVSNARLVDLWDRILLGREQRVEEARTLEEANNHAFLAAYGLLDELNPKVREEQVALHQNPAWQYPTAKTASDRRELARADAVRDLASYAVGCMFGRYSLEEPGLILANQGVTPEDYLAKVPSPTFMPDKDNVIPIVDGDWFEDDIVARVRVFLRVVFGEQHFEENLRFVTESLGVRDIRDYFVKSFYKDHVQRYKKRPIYWLFSSPKGSFNALIYMHRYTPSTVSTVLNEYLREFTAKLISSLQQQERLAAGGGTPRQQTAAQKEADRLRKVLLELEEYEHDVLYPLASRQISIDLDDGVNVNYPKFGAALKKIPGLEASDE